MLKVGGIYNDHIIDGYFVLLEETSKSIFRIFQARILGTSVPRGSQLMYSNHQKMVLIKTQSLIN